MTAAADARAATSDADVVITAASFGPVRQVMTTDWLRRDALVVPVDYATYCSADVAREAALFLVDEREQFLANRTPGSSTTTRIPPPRSARRCSTGPRDQIPAGSSRPTSASGWPTSSSRRRSSRVPIAWVLASSWPDPAG